MSPRNYQLGARQDQITLSRGRVVAAARSRLAGTDSYTAFTVDAVARAADVARATVYYQFGSKAGLLEALCDDLAEAGRMQELSAAFANPDPAGALRDFITCFGRFWAADRPVMRRLRALAALDPDVGAVITGRDARRRAGLEVLTARLRGGSAAPEAGRAVALLYAITSFEMFDALAGPDQEIDGVTAAVIQLAAAVLRPPAS
ncbi:MAG: TetR/AcrR family transcriptional regulator [Streptosporangiaceae bacterium]|jgi:AcrR family transcriptional regulator